MSKPRKIVAVHLYGHPCDMKPIMDIASRHGLRAIENAAEDHSALYDSRFAGALGHVAVFSFYATKIVTTGEGGMITTNDDELAARVRLLHDQAHGVEKRFAHDESSFNYRMTNLEPAVGVAQLGRAGIDSRAFFYPAHHAVVR